MRTNHYWKGAGPAAAPSEIVVFDCETHAGPETSVPGGEYHTLRLGCALAYRLEKGKRTREKRLRFREPDDLWAFIESRLSADRPVWVYGHNLAYDLAAARLWPRLESEDYACQKAILEGGILLIEGEWRGRSLNFSDTFNYYKSSLRSIGRDLGFPKSEMPAWGDSDGAWYDYCMRDVEVTAEAVDRLIAFVRDNELGPWQPTIASLAFSAFRRRFMSHKVLVHTYKRPLEIERAAYYGGIVHTPYIGRVPASPVYELDVCSMYPAVCRNDLPLVFKTWHDRPSLTLLAKLMDAYFCTALVVIKTSTDTYPCRVGKRVIYPHGEYRTALSHPELEAALRRRHVACCLAVTCHTRGPVLKSYMEWFTDKKGAYRREGNGTYASICKLFANSLYGKAGQLTPRWRPWSGDTFREIEDQHGLKRGSLDRTAGVPPRMSKYEETLLVPEYGLALEVRHVFGEIEVKCGQTESRDSHPALAAGVTSYARMRLRRLHEIARAGSVYYSDTDSVWTDADGLSRLREAACVAEGVLGMLDYKGEYPSLTVHGPKDYEAGGVVKRKGIRAGSTPEDDGSYVQLQFPGAKEMLFGGDRGGVMVSRVVKRLHRRITHCKVLDSGYTRPLVMPDERP